MVAVSAAALLAGGCSCRQDRGRGAVSPCGQARPGAPRAPVQRLRRGTGAVEDEGREWQAALERMKLRMRLPETDWDSLAAMRGRQAPGAEEPER